MNAAQMIIIQKKLLAPLEQSLSAGKLSIETQAIAAVLDRAFALIDRLETRIKVTENDGK